jgi:hypothetical protein
LPEVQEIPVDRSAELFRALIANLPCSEQTISNLLGQGRTCEGKGGAGRRLLAKPAPETPPASDHLRLTHGELILGDGRVILVEKHVDLCGNPVFAVSAVEPTSALPALVSSALDFFP